MLRAFALGGILAMISPLAADEPQPKDQKPELLPAPREPLRVIEIKPAYPQPGTREIWQDYAVDGRGRFVPRVIYAPDGAFYLQTGRHYPWTTTRPTLWMPYVRD